MLENKQLEFKEKITDTFLKTVSAYANYEGGKIRFGVNDEGIPVGVSDVKDCCEAIENKINDCLDPCPDYSLSIDNERKIVDLIVEPGEAKPYFYRGKAYGRKGTSTVMVDRVELNRLILEGLHESFDQQLSRNQDLHFTVLADEMRNVGVELNTDILRTLHLCDINGKYNLGALLLADKNEFCGTDCGIFGETIDIIYDRYRLKGESALKLFQENITEFRRHYRYEQIVGAKRIVVEKIPEKAFREALANALVHRTWDTDAYIQISMYPDRVELVSPGGLPAGISKEEYLQGKLSNLRNPILANVFFRLGYIEMFGTGIKRIKQLYSGQGVSPGFEVQENTISVVLPVVGERLILSDQERIIYDCLSSKCYLSSGAIVAKTGFTKAKVLRILEALLKKKYVVKTGIGRGIKYGL